MHELLTRLSENAFLVSRLTNGTKTRVSALLCNSPDSEVFDRSLYLQFHSDGLGDSQWHTINIDVDDSAFFHAETCEDVNTGDIYYIFATPPVVSVSWPSFGSMSLMVGSLILDTYNKIISEYRMILEQVFNGVEEQKTLYKTKDEYYAMLQGYALANVTKAMQELIPAQMKCVRVGKDLVQKTFTLEKCTLENQTVFEVHVNNKTYSCKYHRAACPAEDNASGFTHLICVTRVA